MAPVRKMPPVLLGDKDSLDVGWRVITPSATTSAIALKCSVQDRLSMSMQGSTDAGSPES